MRQKGGSRRRCSRAWRLEIADLEPRAAPQQSFREREDELEAGEGLGLFGVGVGLALITIIAQSPLWRRWRRRRGRGRVPGHPVA